MTKDSSKKVEDVANWSVRLMIGVLTYFAATTMGDFKDMQNKLIEMQLDIAVIKAKIEGYEKSKNVNYATYRNSESPTREAREEE